MEQTANDKPKHKTQVEEIEEMQAVKALSHNSDSDSEKYSKQIHVMRGIGIYTSQLERGGVFHGCDDWKRRISLIPFKTNQNPLQLFQLLNSLCHSRVERPWLIVDGIKKDEVLMVVDPVAKVRYHFSMKTNNDDGSCKVAWKDDVIDEIKIIFRDVIQGLIYLSDKGLGFGSFDDILVTRDGRAKVIAALPGSEKSKEDNVSELRTLLCEIIQMSFGKKSLWGEFDLPCELELFLEMLTPENLKYVDFCWLIDACFFWNSVERINFLCKFPELFQRKMIERRKFSICLEHVLKKPVGDACNWLLKGDIIGFCVAAFKNGNYDYTVAKLVKSLEQLGTVKMGEELSRNFPDIYAVLTKAILCYAKSTLWNNDNELRGKVLRMLLSSSEY